MRQRNDIGSGTLLQDGTAAETRWCELGGLSKKNEAPKKTNARLKKKEAAPRTKNKGLLRKHAETKTGLFNGAYICGFEYHLLWSRPEYNGPNCISNLPNRLLYEHLRR